MFFKDDFHSVLLTPESLLPRFILFHVRNLKMETFHNYLPEVNSKCQNKRHYGCEAVEDLCLVVISLDETPSQL